MTKHAYLKAALMKHNVPSFTIHPEYAQHLVHNFLSYKRRKQRGKDQGQGLGKVGKEPLMGFPLPQQSSGQDEDMNGGEPGLGQRTQEQQQQQEQGQGQQPVSPQFADGVTFTLFKPANVIADADADANADANANAKADEGSELKCICQHSERIRDAVPSEWKIVAIEDTGICTCGKDLLAFIAVIEACKVIKGSKLQNVFKTKFTSRSTWAKQQTLTSDTLGEKRKYVIDLNELKKFQVTDCLLEYVKESLTKELNAMSVPAIAKRDHATRDHATNDPATRDHVVQKKTKQE